MLHYLCNIIFINIFVSIYFPSSTLSIFDTFEMYTIVCLTDNKNILLINYYC